MPTDDTEEKESFYDSVVSTTIEACRDKSDVASKEQQFRTALIRHIESRAEAGHTYAAPPHYPAQQKDVSQVFFVSYRFYYDKDIDDVLRELRQEGFTVLKDYGQISIGWTNGVKSNA
jgi:hypothetical protein